MKRDRSWIAKEVRKRAKEAVKILSQWDEEDCDVIQDSLELEDSHIEELSNSCQDDLKRISTIVIDSYIEEIPDVNDKIRFLGALTGRPCYPRDTVLNEAIDDVKSELTENMIHCSKCDRYIKEDLFTIEEVEEIVEECTYRDAGYGDNDTFENIRELNTYRTCPNCGNTRKIDSLWLDHLEVTRVGYR